MYDAIIIGSGPGGYECAKRIAELGGKPVVIEKDKLGGVCANYGCIPTKALHSSASFFSSIRKAEKYGFTVQSATLNFDALMERKGRIVAIVSQGVKKILADSHVEIIKGEAKIKDRHTVLVGGKELSTKNIVIATGAKPRMLPGLNVSDFIITSKEILELKEMPDSLLIIGGGYIGCELASIFASLGAKVTIIETMPRIVYSEDTDISEELGRIMKRQDVAIFTKSEIIGIEQNKITFRHHGEIKTLEGDKILVAIGMEPFFDKQEMDRLGVKYNTGIVVNNKMQTSVENIYAVGDVTGQSKLAHYAYAQADVAARNIVGHNTEFDESVVPTAIFTIPEISSVGVRNAQIDSAVFRFAANGKARAMGEVDGFVKIYYENGYLKGFCSIGPHASDLVSEAALAIKNNISLKQIKETIHIHPALSEAFLGAVEIALSNKKK